jgi:hypothetical protein
MLNVFHIRVKPQVFLGDTLILHELKYDISESLDADFDLQEVQRPSLSKSSLLRS